MFGLLPAAASPGAAAGPCGKPGPRCELLRWAARRAGRRGWSLPFRLKMAPPIFSLPLIPVPGREPRGRGGGGGDGGGGGGGWRAGPGAPASRRERGSSPACGLSCSALSLSVSSYKDRVVPFKLLVRDGRRDWEIGLSLSLSLAAGGGGR